MAINFPLSPTLNEIYSYNGLSWQWNGSYWQSFPPSSGATGVVTSIIASTGLSANTTTGNVTLVVTGSTGGGTFTGGTVTGATSFTGGLSANTISATTYNNYPGSSSSYCVPTFYVSSISGCSPVTILTPLNAVGGLNVTGTTTFTQTVDFSGGLTASTISATTYQNLPFSGTVINSGTTTSNFIPKWTGTTALTNSQIQDNGINISIGQSPTSIYRFWIVDNNTGTTNSFVVNGSSTASKTAIRGLSNATQYGTGVYGSASSSVESIGLDGLTLNGTLAIGVRGVATPDEFTNITTGIGGYFASDDSYGYGLPTNRYSVQLKDGTEGTNKVLVSTTSDGKSNWSSSLTGLTSVSATTYYNLPISGVTDGSGISTSITNGNLTITATGGGGGGLTFQQVQMIAFLTS
jgi:hypothetical protein